NESRVDAIRGVPAQPSDQLIGPASAGLSVHWRIERTHIDAPSRAGGGDDTRSTPRPTRAGGEAPRGQAPFPTRAAARPASRRASQDGSSDGSCAGVTHQDRTSGPPCVKKRRQAWRWSLPLAVLGRLPLLRSNSAKTLRSFASATAPRTHHAISSAGRPWPG